MSPADVQQLRGVLDEVANELQGAVGLAALVRLNAQNMADDAASLEAAVTRAAVALRRVQPLIGRTQR
jgi:hypothetical protein